MVTTLDYDNFIGKIAVGRIVRGKMKPNQQVAIMTGESTRKAKIGRIYTYNGLNRVETDEAEMVISLRSLGIDDINIGETEQMLKILKHYHPSPSTNQHCPWYSP